MKDVLVELCVKKLTREYGYSEEEARKVCEEDLSNIKI